MAALSGHPPGVAMLTPASQFPKLHIFAVLSLVGVIHAQTVRAPLPKPAHVVIVIEENHGYSQIIGSSQAPYINTLATEGALFTSSYAIAHPSEPNYLDL